MNETVKISKALLHEILVLAYGEGFGCGAGRADFADEATEAKILDLLEEEFPEGRIEDLFPGEFEFTDEDNEEEEQRRQHIVEYEIQPLVQLHEVCGGIRYQLVLL